MKKYVLLSSIPLCLLSIAVQSFGQEPQAPATTPSAPPIAPIDNSGPVDPNAVMAPNSVSPIPVGGSAPHPLPPELSDPLLEGFFEEVGYVPTDRRDPFLPYLNPALKMTQGPEIPLEPLQKFALTQLKLVGIIWDVGQPKALLEDPTGKSHIIVENTKLGQERGYVAAIREGEIIVVEQLISPEGAKSFQTKTLKLSSIKGVTQ